MKVGRRAFLNAWSLILNGCYDQVPNFYGFQADPLATLGTQPIEAYRYSEGQFGIWQMMIWGLRYVFDKFWYPNPAEEGRAIFVPAAYASNLRKAALSELKLMQLKGEYNNIPFLSEGDVVCAWWTRYIVQAQMPETSNRTVAIYNAFGLRQLLSRDLLPSRHAYIANAFCMVPTFMTARDVLTKPLGCVAAAIRESYMDLGTRGQVEAVMSLNRAAQDKGGSALFGDPWMHMVVCTNWTKADLFNVDFTGALAEGRRDSGRATGKPSFIQAHAFARGFSMINGFMVTGKDADGNIWLYGILRKQCWHVIEQMLESSIPRPHG